MQLKDYIQGNRRGKEANLLERESMNDPFLQGALDGFDSVAGDHAIIIEQLEDKYTNPNIVKTGHAPSLRRLFYWASAASVLLLVGGGAYFLLKENKQNTPVFTEVRPVENVHKTPVDSLATESEYMDFQSELIAENTIKKTAPASIPAEMEISPIKAEGISNISVNAVTAKETHSVSLADMTEEAALVAEVMNKEKKTQTISGKVVDESGEPLVGVSIMEKGTKNGTVTGYDGTFSLQLPIDDSSKLLANYIGYKPQEINPVVNQTVVLKESDQTLSEVVVTGYGTQRKTEMTGSVTSVLEGKVAGVDVNKENTFGEKEFQAWCRQRANKNACEDKSASVKISFFIDEAGKPSNIEYQKYSCENAKEEVAKLLSTSPLWTKTNRKVTMTVKW